MSYILDSIPKINMPFKASNNVMEELLSNYTYSKKWSVTYQGKENVITMGDFSIADCKDCEYVINVTEKGIYIKGVDYPSLMRGFVTFLGKIKFDEVNDYFFLESGVEKGNPLMDFRCVHLCIFPETSLEFLKKCVRSCCIAKFSHIIFEFWGMVKFDCMKELAWPFAYSKEQIKEIVKEANALGVEIIPMFNHLGHASLCREVNGKHVILDQNPKYGYMFESYGWVWNFKREDVYNLLSKVRDELIELCGEGKYFHLGCDEAYAYGHNEDKACEMVEYLNKVSSELKQKGRRGILWHDMMLSEDEFSGYISNSDKNISEILLEKLDKDLIIADWQYSVHGEEWKTSKKLKDSDFEVVCCPWHNKDNIDEAVKTVASNNLFGIIHTTWHTLFKGFREMIYAGVVSYGTKEENLDDIRRFYCAEVSRKAMPGFGDYSKCGWSEKMTGPGLH